jgi:hypothetical protein
MLRRNPEKKKWDQNIKTSSMFSPDNLVIDIEDNGCVVVLHNEKGADEG